MAKKKTEHELLMEELGGSCIIPYVEGHRNSDYDAPGDYATTCC